MEIGTIYIEIKPKAGLSRLMESKEGLADINIQFKQETSNAEKPTSNSH